MRLESCIRKGLRMKAHRVREIREENEKLLVAEVERIEGRLLRCGGCSLPVGRIHSRGRPRRWRDLPVRDQELELSYTPVRVNCPRCGPRTEKLPWAGRWQRITEALLLAVAKLSRELAWKKTAVQFKLDWKTVAAAVKSAVARGLKLREWKPLHAIGIDEVSRAKGQRYLTLVYDLERRRLVWAGENRDSETMRSFFSWLGWRRARSVVLVCCDMWAAYVEAVREKLPQATVVCDRFHVVQHVNRAVDEVRREIWRGLPTEEKRAFKNTRWLWLRNPWNLKPEQKRRLSELCRKNSGIVRAYYLKESFQRFWDYRLRGWAEPYMKQWLWWASHSRLKPFVRFGRMIRAHTEGVPAWTTMRISNGALEGMNNKVKMIAHRAFGFRTTEGYITAIWHGCGDLPLG
jgi:transposase